MNCKSLWENVGPIVLSALSIFISFCLLHFFAKLLNPSWTLLASRGICKVAFVTMVIIQVVLLLGIQTRNFLNKFLKTNFYFFKEKGWFKQFATYFILFFFFHAVVLSVFYFSGYAFYNSNWGMWSFSLIARIIFGLIVVFLLAWTEELIFRGTLFPYFEQTFSTPVSVLITSFIFMLVHDLTGPWRLLTINLKMGIGLFLLGLLLNVVFAGTRKLYVGMGIHAGLVFVKVILRRVPFIQFVDQSQWSWWVNKDLRQSIFVHILFMLVILFFVRVHRKKLV